VDIVLTWDVFEDASDVRSDVLTHVQCSCDRETHCLFDDLLIS
jgi:hypothetical protein